MKRALHMMAFILLVAGCVEWPQIETPARTNTSDVWPSLVPLDQLGGTAGDSNAQTEAQRLAARAADLRARAGLMRRSVPDQDAFEALRSRLAR